MPVLITETVRDDEYQRYLAANGYASKTATRPRFHSVKAGLAFDICNNVKELEYDGLSFFDRFGQIAKQAGFSWGGAAAVVVWAIVMWAILMLCGLRLI